MKTLRNIAAITLLVAGATACGGNAENKSIGGSADTGANTSTVGATSVGGLDSAKTDSATGSAKGNADPSGRPQQ